MGAVIALVIAVGLFGSLAVLVTRSERATKTNLEVRGKLGGGDNSRIRLGWHCEFRVKTHGLDQDAQMQ